MISFFFLSPCTRHVSHSLIWTENKWISSKKIEFKAPENLAEAQRIKIYNRVCVLQT